MSFKRYEDVFISTFVLNLVLFCTDSADCKYNRSSYSTGRNTGNNRIIGQMYLMYV